MPEHVELMGGLAPCRRAEGIWGGGGNAGRVLHHRVGSGTVPCSATNPTRRHARTLPRPHHPMPAPRTHLRPPTPTCSHLLPPAPPGLLSTNPGLAKLLAAAVFPLGLALITICGGELFTGNT